MLKARGKEVNFFKIKMDRQKVRVKKDFPGKTIAFD